MPKSVKKKVKQDPKRIMEDKMSDWIRAHSNHEVTIMHKLMKSKTSSFERFMCSCRSCNDTDVFYYTVGTPSEKKPTCKECVE